MKILQQLGIVLAFSLGGSFLSRVAPIGLPSSVWALLLLLIFLRFGWLRAESIHDIGAFLAANMAMFFLPSVVAIAELYHTVQPVIFQLLLVCIVGAVITFLVTFYTTRFVKKLSDAKNVKAFENTLRKE